MGIHVYFFRIVIEELIAIRDDKDKIRKFLKEQMSIKNNPREQWTEKAWEGIHYLLYNEKWFDNKKWEYGTLLYGHVLNPNIYEGYGSPLVQDEEEVRKISRHNWIFILLVKDGKVIRSIISIIYYIIGKDYLNSIKKLLIIMNLF
ncbi:MAG: DUF1877 family protein [Candidatus Heimdallarchaeota archaeon]|nr:DUF1877 family protein [Candidatus Heimdallarchaeota archaeon]